MNLVNINGIKNYTKMNQVQNMNEQYVLKSKTTHCSAYNRLNIFVCTMGAFER